MNEPIYTILYSKEHDFLYDERFHPGRGAHVALRGWRAIVRATLGGQSAVAEAVLGLSRAGTEKTAKELAFAGLCGALRRNTTLAR